MNLKKKEKEKQHRFKPWQKRALDKVEELGLDGAICYYRDVIKQYTNNVYNLAWVCRTVAEWQLEFLVNDARVPIELQTKNKYKDIKPW